MGTNTKSNCEVQDGVASERKPRTLAGAGLTEAQKNFARVVGQALAKAWRCKWQQETAQAGATELEVRDS